MVPMTYVTLGFLWNNNLILTRYKVKIYITYSTERTFLVRTHVTFSRSVFNSYGTRILRPLMDRTEEMIFQHFHWPGIINSVQKEVTNCDTCQRKKRSNKKYGKLPANLAEEIPWNKLCVGLIGPYVIRREGQK